jgi:serine beta-lactamase-like protein LACTB, mitochondrial
MRALLIALLLIAVTFTAAAAELPQAKIEGIERLVTAFMSTNEVPGLSIAVVADGELKWSNGYGLADVENFVPAKATTMYRSASIGKTMTATAALRLEDEGKLDLAADIRDYCPAFPQKQWRITPWNLLTHTGGIRHYGGPRDQAEQYSTTHFPSVVAAMEPFKNDPLRFEPGSKHEYSTYGFDVLGCVIEGASGISFLPAMRRYVWDPAGMAATRDDDPAAIVPNRAAKYRRTDGTLHNAPMVDMSNRLPAGGYLTTAIDLAKFAEALMAGKLVRNETFQRMIAPAKLANGRIIDYGLGWGVEIEAWHDDRWAFHGGSSPGASGFLAIMPRHRFAVVYLTNLENLRGRSELAEDIARLILDFKPRQPAP